MNRVTTIRALILPMPGMDGDAQRKLAKAAGATVCYDAHQQSAWMRALRPGQSGWVWRLSWLAPWETPDGPRPIAEYARIISELSIRIGEGAVLIQGDKNVSSDDRQRWLAAVYDGANQVRTGRRVTADEYRERGEGGRNVLKDRAAVNLLRTTHKSRLSMIRGMWNDPRLPNRAARADAINAQLEAEGYARLGSWQTIWRALKALEKSKR